MTVLVAINRRDSIVMACDNQGFVTRSFIDPADLQKLFFRSENLESEPRLDSAQVDTWSCLDAHKLEIPYKVHSDVQKIFSLEPMNIGVMVSGIASIGERTIKSLLDEFKTTSIFWSMKEQYTLESTGQALVEFLNKEYKKIYTSDKSPELELMICGFNNDRYNPGIIRAYVREGKTGLPDYDCCIFFGGITREIQRLLFGIDAVGKSRIIARSNDLLEKYRGYLTQQLKDQNINIELKKASEFGDDLSIFNHLDLGTLKMNCANYSEKEAIECAEFLVNVMIKSQRFSDQIATTGGNVVIAKIEKHSGFKFIHANSEFRTN